MQIIKIIQALLGAKVSKKELKTVKELLFYSYANLAMAHSALTNQQDKYTVPNYMITSKAI